MNRLRRQPGIFGVLDHPGEGQTLSGAFEVRGWAIARSRQALAIEIQVDGVPVEARVHRTPRPDVLALHTKYSAFNPHPGYLAEISPHALPAGPHTLTVFAQGRREKRRLGQVNFQVPAEVPGEETVDPLYWRASALAAPQDRLMLVHIPKTAGTSLTAFLTAHFPEARTLLHAENQVLGRPQAEVGRLDSYDLVTAHLKLDTLQKYLDGSRYFTISVLRDPVRQLASHLAWVKRLADPRKQDELKNSPAYIQRAVERIESMDLVEFLDTMDERERNLFDNCQFRYFLPQKTAEVDESQLLDAVRRMGGMDLVGTTERLYDFLLVLAFSMGWEPPPRAPRLNTGKKEYFFDLDAADGPLQERIERLTRLDQAIYRHAEALFEARFRSMVKVLSRGAVPGPGEPLTPASLADLVARAAGKGSGR